MTYTGSLIPLTYGQTFSANTATLVYTNSSGGNLALVQLNVECISAASVKFYVTDAGGANIYMPLMPLTSYSAGQGANMDMMVVIPNGYKIYIYCSVASSTPSIIAGASLIAGMI